jgi:hypothetical protein
MYMHSAIRVDLCRVGDRDESLGSGKTDISELKVASSLQSVS